MKLYLADKAKMLSINRAKQAWKQAEPFWGNMPVARIDPKTSESYRERRAHCKDITVRNELAVIRAALNWGKKHKHLKDAPFIKMPSFPAHQIGHLSKAEFRQLLDAAIAPHVRVFMALAVGTGARTNALLDLTWDRVDFQRKLIVLNPRDRVQTSKYRATVPMNAQLLATLKDAKAGAMSDYVVEHGRGRVASIKKGFAAASRRAGVKCTPHMMRHSAAVWMAEAGTPIIEIAQFLGHSDSAITERVYARFSPAYLASAADSLTY